MNEKKTWRPSSKLVFLILTCVGSFYGLHPRSTTLYLVCQTNESSLDVRSKDIFLSKCSEGTKNSPQGDCTHLRVFSASLFRQHALSVHLFCSIICICFVTPRCRCNHIWQVGSCSLCGIRRSGRRSWMDEPETKHAVFTPRDAFGIIYLQPRSLL